MHLCSSGTLDWGLLAQPELLCSWFSLLQELAGAGERGDDGMAAIERALQAAAAAVQALVAAVQKPGGLKAKLVGAHAAVVAALFQVRKRLAAL